jgi:aminomethyltransferase
MDLLGWTYPTAFSGAADEHRAVRAAAGLFDFSFMAHFAARGPDALAFVQQVVANDAARLAPGRAIYSPICNEAGGLVDDCTVIARAADDYLITTGLESTFDWLSTHAAGYELALEDVSADLAVIAVQGPASFAVLRGVGLSDVAGLGYFRAMCVTLTEGRCLVARMGYTGELGYELFLAPDAAVRLWGRLEEVGRPSGLVPCGGIALQSLRIEAGYLMTQADFDTTVTPLEAGLGRFVSLDKDSFMGREALIARGEPGRRLTGFRIESAQAPPPGAGVRNPEGQEVGRVTSACLSPTLQCTLALAYVAATCRDVDRLKIDSVPGPVAPVALPFYEATRHRVRETPAVR